MLSDRLGLTTTVLVKGVIVFSGALAWWFVAPRGAAPAAPPSPWYLYLGGVYGLSVVARRGAPRQLGVTPRAVLSYRVVWPRKKRCFFRLPALEGPEFRYVP